MTPPAHHRSDGRQRLAGLAALLALLVGCGSIDDDAVASSTTTSPATETDATANTTPATTTTTTTTPATTPSSPAPIGPRSDRSIDEVTVTEYRIEVVATHPHDAGAYTQGLELVDGLLLESTGLRGESSLRLVEPTTGEPVVTTPLDDELFGEGATVVGDEIWQLTWTSQMVLIHGLDDLTERRRLAYQGEGWGLCADGDTLVMSDGTSLLTVRDPATFEIIDRVEVLDDGVPLARLNELECVNGVVWANVYQTTRLVAVDPATGRVIGSGDLAGLVPAGYEGDDTNVANGIAHDPETGRFWLTGKRWPVLYEVELVPVS